MELKRHFNFRNCFVVIYLLAFAVFLINGFRPAEATNYDILSDLNIPAINLDSEVVSLKLEDHQLKTPDYLVGGFSRAENKTLLIGHSTTVFKDLNRVLVDDEIIYDEKVYHVVSTEIFEKNEIYMSELLAPADEDTLVLMTCAGESLPNNDATHRLIITAVSK